MFKIRTPEQLLAPHHNLIRSIQQHSSLSETDWDDLYMGLANEIADYLQQLMTREGESLLHVAVHRAVDVHKCLASETSLATSPIRKYAGFATAMLLDVALPVAALEVNVETDSGGVRWNPLVHSKIGTLGEFYNQSWSAGMSLALDIQPILGYCLLPHRARQWFGANSSELCILVCTLQGNRDTPIADYLDKFTQSADLSCLPARQKIRPFLRYLQKELNNGSVNRDESVLHTTNEGLFIQNPNAFQDFDMACWRQTRNALLESDITLSSPSGKAWKYCISKKTGPKIINGFVINLKTTGLVVPPANGRSLTLQL